MELRHLRYFVAIAEAGSFTQAATQRLHTAQPSLSRQIRDLEAELGAQLIVRGPRGMALTQAGQVLLDHARVILRQVDVAREATRRAAVPAKAQFVLGFLTGYEMDWLPRVLGILQDELHRTELTVHSASSPELVRALIAGTMDAAFLRPDDSVRELVFRRVAEEALFVLLPARHELATRKTITLRALVGAPFVSFPMSYAPALRQVIDAYIARAGVALAATHEAETLPMAISLVLSTGGASLLPGYVQRLLPPSVVARKLQGTAPTIALALGYRASNTSALLVRLRDGIASGTAEGQAAAGPQPALSSTSSKSAPHIRSSA